MKSPPKPKLPAEEVLALFMKNLSEVERYHRRQPTGIELGQHVMMSLVFGSVTSCLTLSLEGKSWDPPHP